MGGKGSGRRKDGRCYVPNSKPTRLGSQIAIGNVDPEVNYRTIEFCKSFVFLETVNFNDGEELQKRFSYMLEMCEKWGCKPSVPVFWSSLGLTTSEGNAMLRGEIVTFKGQEVTAFFLEFLKKSLQFLNNILEENLQNEQKNPVKWIFLAKNHFGYSDTKEQVIRTEHSQTALPDASQLLEKYAGQLGATDVIEVENLADKTPVRAKKK